MRKSTSGFTIVELLIVIVVIAILAAITIVAYNGVQTRTNDSVVQNDLSTLSKKLKLYEVDNGRFPASTVDLESLSFKASKSAYKTNDTTANANLGYCTNPPLNTGFAVIVMTANGNRWYVTNSKSPRIDDTGTAWTGNTTQQCTALGYGSAITHGYYIQDTTSGPWRTWVGGN